MADKLKNTSTVRKCMCSFPVGLYKFGQKEAKRIAAEQGRQRPNFSGYLATLLFQAKFSSEQKNQTRK